MKNTEFQINSLRTDKIIYAVESVAFNTAAILAIIIAMYIGLPRIWVLVIAVLALAYTLFMGFGNLVRLRKIKKLETAL